jgi:hypothetical protein
VVVVVPEPIVFSLGLVSFVSEIRLFASFFFQHLSNDRRAKTLGRGKKKKSSALLEFTKEKNRETTEQIQKKKKEKRKRKQNAAHPQRKPKRS